MSTREQDAVAEGLALTWGACQVLPVGLPDAAGEHAVLVAEAHVPNAAWRHHVYVPPSGEGCRAATRDEVRAAHGRAAGTR